MAIAVDSRGTNSAGTTNPYTFNHTTAGSDRLLVVDVLLNSTRSDNVTGVTYNGTSMTRRYHLQAANSRAAGMYAYYLAAPSTGTNTVSVAKTTTNNSSCCAGSYTGVDQTTPINVSATAAVDNTTPISTSITTTVSGCWMVGLLYNSNWNLALTGSLTTGYQTPLPSNAGVMADSDGSLGAAGSYSGGENAGAGWLMLGLLGIAPASGATTNSNFFAFM